jgi:hypothetical protein
MCLLRFNVRFTSDFVSWMEHTIFVTVSKRQKFTHDFWFREVIELGFFGLFYFLATFTKMLTVY